MFFSFVKAPFSDHRPAPESRDLKNQAKCGLLYYRMKQCDSGHPASTFSLGSSYIPAASSSLDTIARHPYRQLAFMHIE
jgi:hypothetical protein